MEADLTLGGFFDRAAARRGDAPYLVWTVDGAVTSYAKMREHSCRLARAWQDLGVRHGDRVAFMADNSPAFLTAWFGLARIGGVLVAVNTGLTAQEAAHVVRDSGSRLILADAHHERTAEEVRRQVDGPIRVLSMIGSGSDLFELAASCSDPEAIAVDVTPNDLLSLIYTSGTTGRPKGVMQTHRNFVLTGQAYPAWMGMEPGERIYACLPLFHINSQAYAAMGAIGAGGTLILSPRFSARRFWDEVRQYRANVFNFIGAMTVVLSKKPPADDDALNDVRVAYGVPALPEDVRQTLEERFGLRIISGFGMSETTFGLIEPLAGPSKPSSMGRPRQHPDPAVGRTQARIVDEIGRGAVVGEVGELQLRNAAMMAGYYGDPEATAAALSADGWLRTGDAARRDSDGYYYFVGRLKDIVRRRGENISPLEIEDVLGEHPAVLEAAVIGVPSAMTDEDLYAYLVLRAGTAVSPETILAWCAPRLAPYKLPRYVEVVDQLPKTPTSKVQKHLLPGLEAGADRRYDREAATP